MKILIDGLDLTGKTTLARALTTDLRKHDLVVNYHRGLLAPANPVQALMRRVSAPDHPASSFLNAAYLLACALDTVMAGGRTQTREGVLVQESYVDRSIAYGCAQGPWWASRLANRFVDVFTSFDLAIFLHAPLDVRRRRLEGRSDGNAVDRVSVAGQRFQDDFMSALQHAGRRHRKVLLVDTSVRSVDEIVEQVAELLGTGRHAREEA